MTIFKCLFNLYVSVTQELLKKIYEWKKVRLNLAKTYNNLIFINRALKGGVWPKGFRRNINIQCINLSSVQRKISSLLMKESLKFLYSKQNKLKIYEVNLREYLQKNLNKEKWNAVLAKVVEDERCCFCLVRERQLRKYQSLLEERGYGETEEHRAEQKDDEYEGYENEIKDKFINISSKDLTLDQKKLLNRNLDFIPMYKLNHDLEIATEVEITMSRLEMKDDTFPAKLREIYREGKNEKDNITKGERNALKELTQDDSLVIAYSDKGKVTIVMDKTEYERKLNEQLTGSSYSLLKKDPSVKIDNAVRKVAKAIKKEDNQPSKVFHSIVGHHTRHPSIFGTIKVHKTGNPMRLIISSFGSVLSNAARFTKEILNNMVMNLHDPHMLSNSFQLKEEIKAMSIDFKDKMLMSIDVTNMFGSINPAVAISEVEKIVKEIKNFHEIYSVKEEDFLELVKLVINNSYFHYQGNYYKQELGIPMGSGLSPIVADIVMISTEKRMRLLDSYKLVELYKRYRDDSYLIWKGNRGEAEEFLEDLNTLDNNIKFTMEMEVDGKLPFLDMLMKREGHKIRFSVFCKPYTSGNCLSFDSYHDLKVKRGLIVGETIRVGRISDEKEKDWDKLNDRLIENGYPRSFIKRNMAKGKRRLSNPNQQKNKIEFKNALILPYEGREKAKKIKRLGKNFGISTVYKKGKNLSGYFSKNYKERTNLEAGGIYEIDCGCKEKYVGETGNLLNKRIKQHKYSVNTMDMKNGVAAHRLNCEKNINWDEIKLLTQERSWWKRKIKESLFIQKEKPTMNLNQGICIVGKWN